MKALKAIIICTLVVAASAAAAAQTATSDAQILHVLERLGFGPRPGDVDRVRAIGLEQYIAMQLEPAQIEDRAVEQRLARFETLGFDSREMASRFFTPPQQNRPRPEPPQMTPQAGEPGQMPVPAGAMREARARAGLPLLELSQQKLLRAVYSERQLEEVLVDFWFNHFNVFAGKGQFARFYLTEYEREAIRPYVLGRFRDMLGATAKSPAMLWYLDNWMSAAPAAASRQAQRPARGLNENYGRELLELHTLGVDGGYTQQDVVEVARAFTGWTIDSPRRGGGSFLFNPRMHDNGVKTVLGTAIPAGGGQRDGERVLDMLAAHPSTARHIARKLATRFVSDTPPQALVDRAAKVFLDTGGDLRHVTRAIVMSPEFLAAEARGVKVKTPFEFAVSAIRASGAEVRNAAPLVQQLRTLGMPLYGAQPPTGYDDTAASWINSGALIARMNFAAALAANRLPGTRVPAGDPEPLARRLGSPEFQKR
jgi:uncharacterized protein (DUF1800 family)